MDVHELVKRGSDEVVAIYCGKCGTVFRMTEPDQADGCCKPRMCKCGKPTMGSYVSCDSCIKAMDEAKEKATFDKATKIQFADYKGDFVFSEALRHDGYLPTDQVEERLADMKPEDRPRYVWACVPFGLDRLDASDVLSSYLEEHHEEAEESLDVDELQKILDDWRDKQSLVSYGQDLTTAILLDSVLAEVAKHEAKTV